jgi:hypothetical protein
MLTKHFLKTLILFTMMIMLGLVGVFLVGYFDKEGQQTTAELPTCETGEMC